MKKMTSAEVREAFLEFFEEMRHKQVASSSLVPGNDPTLLFTNAGMVQFKDVFLGLDKRPYTRATTSQKCMRVSGKHNDLENVGPSPRHHTFFEMLGNFSFGDYFKRDAIHFAYNLFTQVYEMPLDRLAFTVYRTDDEAYNIWVNELGVPPERVARLGPKTNFWQMADTGPCGPTSEIHWDLEPEKGTGTIIAALEEESDRFLELWNLVFMQFNRTQPDPSHSGQWDEPLPAPGVDTGAGLERIVSVLQRAESNYDTDLFMPIIERVQALAGTSDAERAANYVPYRVIADHMRAATFLITDGVRPGATGRDYVCRMVIRRAVRFGTKLGFEQPFLADVADAVIDVMGGAYPDIVENRESIRRTITNEEVRFRRAMDRALAELDEMLGEIGPSEERLRQLITALDPSPQQFANMLATLNPNPSVDQVRAMIVAMEPTLDQLENIVSDIEDGPDQLGIDEIIEKIDPTPEQMSNVIKESVSSAYQLTRSIAALNPSQEQLQQLTQLPDLGISSEWVHRFKSDFVDSLLPKMDIEAFLPKVDVGSLMDLVGVRGINTGANIDGLGLIDIGKTGLTSGLKDLFMSSGDISGAISSAIVGSLGSIDVGKITLANVLAPLFPLPGDQAFRLHAEKGLPLEITRDVAKEYGFSVDEEGFRLAQQAHEAVSRGQGSGAFGAIDMGETYLEVLHTLRQQGAVKDGVAQDQYGSLSRETRVLAILRDGALVESAAVGDRVEIVLEMTPFYAEAGGQVSDTGVIEGHDWAVDVEDVRRPVGGLIVHSGEVIEGQPQTGAECVASVDAARRLDIQRNHTATHLLHAELRRVLGTHVQQRGSLVAPDRLRFDFSHDAPITSEELDLIAHNINEAILADLPVTAVWKDLEAARSEGAMALFGEKYGDRVRTITIEDRDFSYELCGGNHVEQTGVIGSFVFTSEGSVAQGIRRVEALTGHGAEAYIRRSLKRLGQAAHLLATSPDEVVTRIGALQEVLKDQQQENARLRRRVARLEFEDLLRDVTTVDGVAVLVAQVSPTATDTLREMTDWFRDKVDSGVVVLGMVAEGDRPQLIAAVSKDLTRRVHAGNLIKQIAAVVGGGGGGRPDMAQAGGKDADQLGAALALARDLIAEALS